MPGVMNKANQRQAQKSKQGRKYGLKRVRIHEIPLVCKCGKTITVSSSQAYTRKGNLCMCGRKFAFNVKAFPKPQLVKK